MYLNESVILGFSKKKKKMLVKKLNGYSVRSHKKW